MNPAVHPVDVVKVGPDVDAGGRDVAAAEEPLEIRLGGTPFVVIMRTPGADHELAAGFLLAEQVVMAPTEIVSMRYCTDDGGDEAVNVLNVWLGGEGVARAAAKMVERRHVTATSACGVCGRRSIDDLMDSIHSVEASWTVSRDVIAGLPARLRGAQEVFEQTGGLHAAGLFDRTGALAAVAEDVGRHNAVDKVVGAELLKGRLPLSDRILFVSGRTSFEIVQKAVVAGVPVIASVSAPSSLAIELAREAGATLIGFVRGGSFNIYAGAQRIAL